MLGNGKKMSVGGILLLWDKRVVEKIEECIGVYSLAVQFKNIEDDSIWAFAGVYGPNLASHRRILWEKLAGVMSWWNLPWCIGGISMSPTSLAKDLESLVVWLCLIFLSSFMTTLAISLHNTFIHILNLALL
jgi:hypothetical protein